MEAPDGGAASPGAAGRDESAVLSHQELPRHVRALPALTPDHDALVHLELLLNGGYAPLSGFMTSSESVSVRKNGQLTDGSPWPVPVSLGVPDELSQAAELLLTDPEGAPLARLEVTERWWADGGHRLAGAAHALRPAAHGVAREFRIAPARVAAERETSGHADRPVLAVLAHGPLHHRALGQIKHAAESLATGTPASSGSPVEVLVLVDTPFQDDRPLRAVLAAEPHLPPHTRVIALSLPRPEEEPDLTAERYTAAAGHIAANYGATHVLLAQAATPAGISCPVPVIAETAWCYDTGLDVWRPAAGVPPERQRSEPSAAEVDELLQHGTALPEWFTPSAVAAELAAQRPARSQRGLVLFFTGLSGSGKSTVARGAADAVREAGRTVSLLDGDVVRRMLSAGLTFSRADRDLNIRRIGYVAAEIARHGGVAICAPIAPYEATRAEVRAMAEQVGDFRLVHVSTPIEVCEARDRKGLYAKARSGEIPEFTGVSDPYEEPGDAELVIDTSELGEAEAVAQVMDDLRTGGWLPATG